MSLSDVKTKSTQKQNPFQRAIKSISDVFIEFMPGILAAAFNLLFILSKKNKIKKCRHVNLYKNSVDNY